MSSFERRSHNRKLSSGRIVRVSKHEVSRDSAKRFEGYGTSGSISRLGVASKRSGTGLSFMRLEKISSGDIELVTQKPHSRMIPNAKCPVCGAAVFFYSNDAGAAVFFDEVGRPWPKHPCTDGTLYVSNELSVQPKARTYGSEKKVGHTVRIFQVIKRRKIGLTTYISLADCDDTLAVAEWATKQRVSVAPGQRVIVDNESLSYFALFDAEPIIVDGQLSAV